MNLKPLLFSTLLIVMSSCSNNQSSSLDLSAEYNFNLIPSSKKIEIPVDSSTSNVSNFLTYYYDKQSNTEYLISINSFIHELQFFSLIPFKASFSIPIEMNGSKGIGPMSAVYIHNMDSIFVFPSQDLSIYMIDSAYQTYEKIDYEEPIGYTNARPSMLFFAAFPFLDSNKLVVKTLYQTNFRTVSNTELSKVHLSYTVNLKTSKTEPLPHFYPNDYFEKGMKHFDFSASITDKQFVYSFFGDHHLYLSNSATQSLIKRKAKSKFIQEELPLFPADGNRLERAKYLSIQDHYGSLVYDEYRDVYYRFCYPKLDKEELKEIMKNLQNPSEFSIQIFDQSLNIIGETLFENNTRFLPKNFFIGKEGLYMSNNHSDNQDINESLFSFTLLELKESSSY